MDYKSDYNPKDAYDWRDDVKPSRVFKPFVPNPDGKKTYSDPFYWGRSASKYTYNYKGPRGALNKDSNAQGHKIWRCKYCNWPLFADGTCPKGHEKQRRYTKGFGPELPVGQTYSFGQWLLPHRKPRDIDEFIVPPHTNRPVKMLRYEPYMDSQVVIQF